MNIESFKSATYEAIERLPEQLRTLSRMEAEKAIEQQLNAMKRDGRLMLMTDEEERLIRAFRRFKMHAKKAGEVFKWQTRPTRDVLISEETALIRDPQEVAGREASMSPYGTDPRL